MATDRQIIMVGDYINRGPDSRGVIELLLEARRLCPSLVLLRGNHEEALLGFLDNKDSRATSVFLHHGGLKTMKSYSASVAESTTFEGFRRSFPHSHYSFIAKMPAYFEAPGLLVSHLGFDPARPLARDISAMVSCSHPELFTKECQSRLPRDMIFVFGHYVQSSGRPYVSDQIMCIDVGCGTIPDAQLCALLLPEFQFIYF